MSDFKEDAPGAGNRAGGAEDRHHHHPDGASIAENASPTKREALIEAARGYLARGWTPIRLGPRAKVPPGKHDANTVTAENAERLLDHGGYNLGLRLGPEHGGLVDFDLDWPEARRIGAKLLFALPKFGRAGAPGSHYLFLCPGFDKTVKFDIPELKGTEGLPEEHAACVLEVRGKGHTMAPPSVHPSGEQVSWERDVAPLSMSAADALKRAGLIAFLSVVARFYPAQGSRDDFCMALSGALLAAKLSVEDVNHAVVLAAEIAGDEEAGKRGKAGQTAAKVEAGEAATGLPRGVEMLGLPEAVAGRFRKWLGITEGRADDRPEVVYSENRLPETLDAAEAALLTAGVPIYQSAGRLVQPIRLDASGNDDGVLREAGALLIRELRPHRLRELMIGSANFVKIVTTKQGTDTVPTAPPVSFAHSYAAREGFWRLPVLRGVVECPTLRPDGTVLADDGYDAASGLILDTGGATFGTVPESPSRADAVAAMGLLKELLEGFPFVDVPSRSVALSAMLTAVCRKMLRTAPLHGFTAPTMGTGKSLIADVVAILGTGRDAPVMSQGATEEEDEKRLLSILMQGDPVVVIDNVTRPVTGDALCSILTSETWQNRKLGTNDQIRVPTQTLFIANGNNLQFREDMSTRAIMCAMDAKMEHPEKRTFTVDLRTEVRRRRGELVAAALTVLRAFIFAGRPGARELEPFGRFEDWSALVRAALVWCGEPDPCATRASVSVGDSAREELAGLIEAWEAAFGVGRYVKAAELIRRSDTFQGSGGPGAEELGIALRAACPRGVNPHSVGIYLSKKVGRIVRGRRIVRRADDKDASTFCLEAVPP
ncbi:MAG: bifunctional DNA primase/polymerase [Alphaproteobacteria bacterium]|nr:bifunctional DNA primase/polymerase [Alphaproteobacteria bacterium]